MWNNGAAKDTLNGLTRCLRMACEGLSASLMRFVDELFGVVSRAASGLEDEGDKVDVWISVKFDLFSSLGHVTWAGVGCRNASWAA